MSRARIFAALAAMCLLLVACSDSGNVFSQASSSSASSSSSTGRGKGKAADNGDDEAATSGGSSTCPTPVPAPTDKTAQPIALSDTVSAVAYPLADHPGNPWSQWGQGIVRDGKFFSAVGDECGINGDSYVYEFDPSTSTLRMLGDVFSVVDHQDGAFGYGKIHAQMVGGADGMIYATTYWGSRRNLEYTNGYEGDVLLRIDPSSGSITNLGVPVPNHGIPTLAASRDGKLIFGEAAEPEASPSKGLFFVYDIGAGKVVFQHDLPEGAPGYRSILVDGSGKAWFSVGDGTVAVYDPSSNSVADSSETIPGKFLRAATHPAPDGTVYGVTQGDEQAFFKVSPDGHFTSLGPAQGYTTSLALSDDGSTIYYVPDAHGKAFENGTPLIARKTDSGDEQVVVRLNDLVQPKLNMLLGGSYDVVLDGSTLYIGLNAGDPSSNDGFGSVVLATVNLS